MSKIYIDEKEYQVDSSQNMLHVALSLGLNLPYFCWHPALGSVGACRQCAVKQFKNENDDKGRIVMACMTSASDGTRISIDDLDAVNFRSSVTEWLMLNHPHDCPICDEGGECHLQDMTVMTGHVYRRKRFDKRTFNNQYLGPFINHEMNRCIECYRCVRFYKEFAGGRDFDVFSAHDHVYFGRQEDGVLQSEFSGNLVEVCPTGVFTDKSLKQHYTRKWDMQTAPSVCVHCSLGCNTIPGERYSKLRRIRNRYNSDVNGYFLCDRGRYGYEFVNSQERIREPQIRTPQSLDASTRSAQRPQPVSVEEVLSHLNETLKPDTPLIGIGSPRASLESNFALRTLVGKDNFFAGISAEESHLTQLVLSILRDGPVRTASLQEAAQADIVLVLGEDVTNTAPMLALSLRQAIRNKPKEMALQQKIDLWNDAAVREKVQEEKGPLYIAVPKETRLDDVAESTIHLAPDDIARLAYAIAHAIHPSAPEVDDLPDELELLVEEIADKLKDSEKPLIVSGTGLKSEAVIQAAANVAWALRNVNKDSRITFAIPECNSMGLAMLDDKNLDDALQAVKNNKEATLVILENDVSTRANAEFVNELIKAANKVIAVDALENATTSAANVVLPAATFAEGDGTLVNNETRAQRFFQVLDPVNEIKEGWRWIIELMNIVGHEYAEKWKTYDDVLNALAESDSSFAPVRDVAPEADFRIADQKIPRQPFRYSGRTAMRANIDVSEPKPPDDPDTPLAFSMEGYKGIPPASLMSHYWSPGWNSVQSLNKFQEEVGGLLKRDSHERRLIEESESGETPYFEEIPDTFVPRDDEYRVVPLHHIFGSEELSRFSSPILERIPTPYLMAGKKTHLDEGQQVEIDLNGYLIRLPVQLSDAMPEGVIGLPLGLPPIPAMLPVLCRLKVIEGANE